jgi:hypothetical protein
MPLVPYLEQRCLGKVLETALEQKEAKETAKAVAELAPYLENDLRTRALERGLDAVQRLSDRVTDEGISPRTDLFTKIVPHLEGELLENALKIALGVSDHGDRMHALLAFLPVWYDEDRLVGHILEAVASYLLAISDDNREKILRLCTNEVLFAPPLFSQHGLASIANHIIQVCFDFRFL